MPNRGQAIIWTIDGLVYWRMYASLGLNELIMILFIISCLRQVASSIASLHRVDAHALKLVNRKGVVSPLPFEPGVRYVRILKWFISMAPEKLKDPERDERYANNRPCRLVAIASVYYRQTSNIRYTLVGNKIVDHSDVVGASPVGSAVTTSSFST